MIDDDDYEPHEALLTTLFIMIYAEAEEEGTLTPAFSVFGQISFPAFDLA